MTYEEQYAAYLDRVQGALSAEADRFLNHASKVAEAARYSLFSGGKRVRAVLCLAVCELLQGDAAQAESFAAGVEMLHCYSLIHDDLPCMDDDDIRRGRPSCHKAYGEDTALLAGDALLTAAFETLAAAPGGAARNAQACAALAQAAGTRGMIYGQELDLFHETTPATHEQLLEVHKNKTGMLINAAVQLGAVSAGACARQRDVLAAYAFDVGLVFQIVDDVLDVTSTSETLGKPVGSDGANGKTTFVTLFGVEESRRMAQEITQRACRALEGEYGERAAFLCQFARSLVARHQ